MNRIECMSLKEKSINRNNIELPDNLYGLTDFQLVALHFTQPH